MAETVKDCMAFDDAWLLLQVHDELIFECYEEDVDELLPVLRETITTCTNNIVKWRVKFESDVKAGNSWASIKG